METKTNPAPCPLAVMDLAARAATDYDALTERGLTRAELWAEMAEARAAVAELVEADREYDAARKAVTDAEGFGHGFQRLRATHPLVTALIRAADRRDAALAKFNPGA